MLGFNFADIIVSLLPLFYVFFVPLGSVPTLTPLRRWQWPQIAFANARTWHFPYVPKSFLFSVQHRSVPGFSFFLHLLRKNLCSNHHHHLPRLLPLQPRPKCLRAICNLLNPANIEIYVPLDKGYPALMLCMCWYPLASQVWRHWRNEMLLSANGFK